MVYHPGMRKAIRSMKEMNVASKPADYCLQVVGAVGCQTQGNDHPGR